MKTFLSLFRQISNLHQSALRFPSLTRGCALPPSTITWGFALSPTKGRFNASRLRSIPHLEMRVPGYDLPGAVFVSGRLSRPSNEL